MSEWGNPAGFKFCHLLIEEPTQGIETSQYLEEEKSNEIPQVAASERGRAQTGPFRGSGVVGLVWGIVPHDRLMRSRSELERSAAAGESPVGELMRGV
jgi:hypothetical protein